jgi:fimbrial chaperone protein
MNVYNRRRSIAITRPGQTVCAALLLAATPFACAGNFGVSPLRVDLKAAHRLEVLTVTNSDDQPLAIQVQLLLWSQQDGEEQYVDTRDLLATPPIFKMGPHGQQIIRIALRREPDPARELDYRVLITEIPQPPAKDFSGLQIALRMSLPIFVAPAVPEHAELQWQAHWSSDGSLQISATNAGNAHAKVTDFDVRFDGSDSPAHVAVTRYVLPGSRVSWTLRPEGGTNRQAAIHLHGTTDRGEFAADVADVGS